MTKSNDDPDQLEPQEEARLREIARLEYEEHKQEVSDRLRFQVEFAQALLKSLLLVNGAAVISLLTFIGNTANEIQYDLIRWSFASFAVGITASLVSYFGAFFSQLNFMQSTAIQMWVSHGRSHGLIEIVNENDFKTSMRNGVISMNVGIAGAIVSILGFGAGAFLALEAIL